MKKMLLWLAILVVALVASGCATTLSQIQDRLGPPAKIEKTETTTTYTYYYYKGTLRGTLTGSEAMVDWTVWEFVGDQSGKVFKKRHYIMQPSRIPQGQPRQ